MKLKHFGDSYDIVKKSLIHWLAAFGPWVAHPMFSHEIAAEDAAAYGRFLGVHVVSTEVLMPRCDRRAYLAACTGARSVFLDPDTGVRLHAVNDRRSPGFIFGDELVEIAHARSEGLVMTFDQSLARGRERQDVQAKLVYCRDRGATGFAYVSHASFLVLGNSARLVREAQAQIITASSLPESRFVVLDDVR